MTLKPTKAEQGVFSGCLIAIIIGMFIGGIAGYIWLGNYKIEIGFGQSLISAMAILVGAVSGATLSGIVSIILNAVISRNEKKKEEDVF